MAAQNAELYLRQFCTMTSQLRFNISLLTDLSQIQQLLRLSEARTHTIHD